MKHRVSIIIPSFQRPSELARCVESIPQDRAEIIVVDDGTVPPIVRPAGAGWQLYRQPNLGPAAARNLGAAKATGEIFFFIDDDATLLADTLDEVGKIFAGNPDVTVVGADILSPDDQNRWEAARSRWSKMASAGPARRRADSLSSCALAIRRETYVGVGGFDEAFECNEDDDLSRRLRNRGEVLWRSREVKVVHHVKFQNFRAFRAKIRAWAGESDDLLVRKHGLAVASGLAERWQVGQRIEFLARPRFGTYVKFLFAAALDLFAHFWGACRRRNVSGIFLETLWRATYLSTIARRYLGELLARAVAPFGGVTEAWRYYVHAKIGRRPLRLILFITNRCPADCAHCFYFAELNSRAPELTLDHFDEISRELGKLRKVNLTGGEPFVRRDIVRIAHIFYRRNKVAALNITTNGYAPDRIVEATREILRRCPAMGVTISVSLDGPREVHDEIRRLPGSYDRAWTTLKRLADEKNGQPRLRIGVNATSMPANEGVLPQFLREIRKEIPACDFVNGDVAYPRLERGFSQNRLPDGLGDERAWRQKILDLGEEFPAFDGRPAGYLRRVLRFFQDYRRSYLHFVSTQTRRQPVPCRAHRLFAVVRENGDVSYCEERETIGNVTRASITEIWRAEPAKRVSASIERNECGCGHCIFQGANWWARDFTPASVRVSWRALRSLVGPNFSAAKILRIRGRTVGASH